MASVYRRSKKQFGSARAAWLDVAGATGLLPGQVDSDHTGTHWVFKKKRPRRVLRARSTFKARM